MDCFLRFEHVLPSQTFSFYLIYRCPPDYSLLPVPRALPETMTWWNAIGDYFWRIHNTYFFVKFERVDPKYATLETEYRCIQTKIFWSDFFLDLSTNKTSLD